jgi:anti-sigma regulatory factor (Ser/Thr protein kinase)
VTNARGGAKASFPPEAASVGLARQFVARTLRGWNAEQLVPAATSICSELCTNAVLHARTGFTVTLALLAPDSLRLEVRDGSGMIPRPRRYSTQATTGRGLNVVAGIAAEWGVSPEPDGKCVWARITGAEEEPDLSGLFADDLAELTGGAPVGCSGRPGGARDLAA